MRYPKSNQIGALKKIALNLGVIISVYFLTSLLACLVMFFSKNPTGNIFTYSLFSFLLSGLFSGFIVGKMNSDNKGLAVVSAILFSILLLVIGIISGGKITSILMNVMCYFMVFGFSLFLSGIKRRKRYGRR